MKKIKTELLLFIISFLFIVIFTKNAVDSANDESRIATIESLVERGTFQLDDSIYISDPNFVDKIFVDGHFYSSKPPVLSYISAPVYFILYYLGFRFRPVEVPSMAYYLQTLLIIGTSYSFLITFFYKFLIRSKKDEKDALFLTISMAVGTLIFPYSTVFNNHLPSVTCLFVSFYLILYADDSKNRVLTLFVAGILSGFAVTFEPPLILMAAFFSILFVKQEKKIFWFTLSLFLVSLIFILTRRNFVVLGFLVIAYVIIFFSINLHLISKGWIYGIGIMLPIILYLCLNFVILGSIIPQHLHPNRAEFYTYPGAPWPGGHDPSGVMSKEKFFIDSTVGKRGLLSYSPILLFGLAGLYLALKNPKTKTEAMIIGLSTFLILIYYTLTGTNFGGYSYGNRRLVVLTPFLLMYARFLFPLKKKYLKTLFIIALLFSIIISLVGVYKPWGVNNFKLILENIRI